MPALGEPLEWSRGNGPIEAEADSTIWASLVWVTRYQLYDRLDY